MQSKEEVLFTAIRAALKAGEAIMQIYNDPEADFEVERKADNSPLTRADKAAHREIMAILSDTPYPILSEEGRDIPFSERTGWDTLWIVDPLDGTKEFIKKNGEFTVNIALVEKNEATLGVIYVPVRRLLYFGELQTGAYRAENMSNDTLHSLESLKQESALLPLKIAHSDLVVVASRSHLSPETKEFIDNLESCGKPISLISCGSSLKICLIAEGAADIYPRFAPTMEWDTAAGHAIARAAGRDIYHTDRAIPLRYNKEDLLNPWFIAE